MAQALPGYVLTELEDAGPPEQWLRRRLRFENAGSDLALDVMAYRSGGVLHRIDIEARALAADRPLTLAILRGDCTVLQARALLYEAGSAQELAILAGNLETEVGREPLNPPVPPGVDVGGVTVAHVDSGVNYLLPRIASRLARDAKGRSLGYDFWDLDDRPFDGDIGRSPFFPQRHGTRVASLLLREAPQVRLVPYRYPRPDLGRMAELVAAAASADAAIVLIPLGSTKRADWEAFEAAARAQPDLLFIVSAGNDGRDIDARPVYPAGLPLDNMIVVTSSDQAGYPAPGSNWGALSVDLMVPAELQSVTGFTGETVEASGSSFAVPRLGALAARLKAAHPGWRAADLKRAIFAHAVPPPPEASGAVARGWIPQPDAVRN
ncbi:MAG: S8 family serine peptidase [Kiloniellaceae bacterium]